MVKEGDDLIDIESRCMELLKRAAFKQASDIHFKPKKNIIEIHFRTYGHIHVVEKISEALYNRMLSHFKFQANMDIGEKRKPQNGSLALQFNGKTINIRLSTLPTPHNESLVLRLLPQDDDNSFENLFLFKNSAKPLLSYMKQEQGLIIVTGPTGSGKTTTIYALLAHAARVLQKRVISIEDPIEKLNDLFIQMEVNPKAGITYYEGFKAILRHDPDIIFIGEIRDKETAKIVIEAALSGHLIVSTMHAKNTLGAIYRMLEFNISLADIEQTMTAIVTQKLINILCSECRDDCEIDSHPKKRLALIEILAENHLKDALSSIKQQKTPNLHISTLDEELKKAIALGFVKGERI